MVAWLIWRFSKWKNRPPKDRPDIPYRAFTTLFDVVADARYVPELIAKDAYPDHVPKGTEIVGWEDRIDAARAAREQARSAGIGAELCDLLGKAASDLSLVLIIDQSGSMRNRIVDLAGQISFLAEVMEQSGVDAAILGFTTLNWKGGEPRQRWLAEGKMPYPGRLCALLHVVYKQFGAPLQQADWRAMLCPNALRENVDGEALEWATGLLEARKNKDLRLIVVSDGAPVDDSTIAANGPHFLERNLRSVARALENQANIRLGRIGYSDYDPGCFQHQETIRESSEFLSAFARLMAGMNEKPD